MGVLFASHLKFDGDVATVYLFTSNREGRELSGMCLRLEVDEGVLFVSHLYVDNDASIVHLMTNYTGVSG